MKYLLIIILFASCSAAKRAKKSERLVNKAIKLSRVTVAKVTRDMFPCIVVNAVNDSTEYINYIAFLDSLFNARPITSDTNYFKPAPALNCNDSIKSQLIIIDRYKLKVKEQSDFINKIQNDFKKLPPIHDTTKIKDSAEVFIAQKETAVAQEEKEKYKGRAQRRGNLNLYLIIAFLISLFLNFIQFKRK